MHEHQIIYVNINEIWPLLDSFSLYDPIAMTGQQFILNSKYIHITLNSWFFHKYLNPIIIPTILKSVFQKCSRWMYVVRVMYYSYYTCFNGNTAPIHWSGINHNVIWNTLFIFSFYIKKKCRYVWKMKLHQTFALIFDAFITYFWYLKIFGVSSFILTFTVYTIYIFYRLQLCSKWNDLVYLKYNIDWTYHSCCIVCLCVCVRWSA